ncbi:MAG: exodeoxyribonuclease III [Bacteroidota bacterium]|nr:exodeoxyribonuclease III [Bacteroidota bacterium]MDP4228134.1 exodeoxyribonuclease III [Bacteroidota bacterium]MDP4273596.1 exodeoxyribonuclease III [Bacteroidota bacterium]
MKQKLISYNVNGLRAAINKGFFDWLKEEKPDILCMQETKAQPEQIDQNAFEYLGYQSILHSAVKKGYSGVGVFTKNAPDNIVIGMGSDGYDAEGRVIRCDYGDITLICVYIPSGTMGDVRQDFKMQFLADFQKFIDNLKKERPNIIVTGDFNICHTPIDINHPERHENDSGFLPEERAWVSGFLESGFIDTFREFNQEPEQYSWWSYRQRAREKNLGWRIDYFMVSEPLRPRLVNAGILSAIVHSDHCPIWVEIDF